MEVNLENILSRDCSSRCRDARESSSIRRRRSRNTDGTHPPPFEQDQGSITSLPSPILQRKKTHPSHFPLLQEKQRPGEMQSKHCINTLCT
nr:uncharacterized protein LOC106031907 [Anser cygnoides]